MTRTRVWPASASFERGRLVAVGGMAVDELARRYGTPLYVIDRDELVARARAYRDAFAGADVVYAAKALCVTGVLQVLGAEGLWVDVASGGELHTAVRAGVPGERIVFHGNNKSADELAQAAEHGVGRVVVDSFSELERLAEIGGRLDVEFDVWLRITPGVEAHTHDYVRTGHDDSKFGFTLSAGLAQQAVEHALSLPHVRLRGVHYHIGSQVFTVEAFVAAALLVVDLLAQVRDRVGVVLEELNLGGGLGISYTEEEEPPAIAEYADALRAAVARACRQRGLPLPRLAVEPGRSIAGPAGITLYTIGTIKRIPGVRTYVAVDGGMSDNPRPALYQARYTFAPAGSGTSGHAGGEVRDVEPVDVAGKHCESGDVIGRDVPLPAAIAEGELLAVAATGAYSYSMASNYNRLPRPAMVLVADGGARLLVRRESLDDLLSHDVPLA